MDHDSVAVVRDGRVCATLQRHDGRPPRLVPSDGESFNLDELEELRQHLDTFDKLKASERSGYIKERDEAWARCKAGRCDGPTCPRGGHVPG